MLKTKDEIEKWLLEHHIYDYKIQDNLIVNVSTNISLSYQNLTEIPVQFGRIYGAFDCSHNELTTLCGIPFFCLSLNCSYNKLTSLKYCPNEIEGYFDCSYNQLSSLQYGPQIVGSSYICKNNLIKKLNGIPNEINGYFDCSNNKLKKLNGISEKIHELLDISGNNIDSLEHIQIVGGDIVCNHVPINQIDKLPTYVGGEIKITHLDKLIRDLDEYYNTPINELQPYKINLSLDEMKKAKLKAKLIKELHVNFSNKTKRMKL